MITLEFEILPKEGGIVGSVISNAEGEIPEELMGNVQAMIARTDPTAETTICGKCVAFSSGLPFSTAHEMAEQIKAGIWESLSGVEVAVTCLKPERLVIAANFELDMEGLVEHLRGRVAL